MTALIVDDEPLAREYLRRLLTEQGVDVVGEAQLATEAIALTRQLRPDILFLDIQMPGFSGLQLAEALRAGSDSTQIVFVTGYSQYATDAFETAVMDYLMKPVSPQRLAKTLMRARPRQDGRSASDDAATADEPPAPDRGPNGESLPLQRLPIRKTYAVLLVKVEEILAAVAKEKRVIVRTIDGEHRTYYTLTQLETLLSPERFLRVHDSALVNVDAIKEVLLLGNHTYALLLTNGDQIPVSRSRYPALQRRLGLSPSGDTL